MQKLAIHVALFSLGIADAWSGKQNSALLFYNAPTIATLRTSPAKFSAAAADENVGTEIALTKEKAPIRWRGLIGVAAGAGMHLSCGSMYCWGNLLSYMPPELKYWAGAAAATGVPDAQFVLAYTIMAQTIGMPIGPYLYPILGARKTALLGSVLMGSGVILASYATSLATFVPFFCVMFGLGVGIAYQMPILTGTKWFPKSKGGVSGAVIFGMGASAFFFNKLATAIVNPTGINPVGGLFPASIYATWPKLLRTLGSIYLACGLIGASFQVPPPAAAEPEKGAAVVVSAAPASSGNSLLADITSKPFVTMWLMIISAAIAGLNIASSYKLFGVRRAHLNGDAYLSLIGGLASLLGNAAGRIFWGTRSDKLGFKRTILELTALQAACMASYLTLSATRLGFGFVTVTMLFCMGGAFAMFPGEALRRKWKSPAANVYGFMFSAFALAALGGPYVTKFLMAMGGEKLVFGVLSCAPLVAMALSRTL